MREKYLHYEKEDNQEKIEENAKTNISKRIARILTKYIHNNGMNKKDFAAKAKIKESTFNGYVNGDYEPKMIQLVKIAKTMNVSTDYLLGIKKTKSKDYGIDYIVNTTGLSEEAVENLIRINGTYKENLIKVVNFLIEEDLYYPEEEYLQMRIIELEDADITEEQKRSLNAQIEKESEEFAKIYGRKKPLYIISKLEEYFTTTFNAKEKLYATKDGVFLEKDLEDGLKKYSIKAMGKEINLSSKLIDNVLLDEVRDVLQTSKSKYLNSKTEGDN